MALGLGATRCLRKPFRPAALLMTVNECLALAEPQFAEAVPARVAINLKDNFSWMAFVEAGFTEAFAACTIGRHSIAAGKIRVSAPVTICDRRNRGRCRKPQVNS